MDSDLTYHDAFAALAWQVELGADEAILDEPVNRFESVEKPKPAAPKAISQPVQAKPSSAEQADLAVSEAKAAAKGAADLDALYQALSDYSHCELKRGARNTVFADGNPDARVMVIGEAPGRDEDIAGKPFVGRAGQLLDRMFGAIDFARAHVDATRSLYITNILPWRPPQNRDPQPDEIAMMMPFIKRHIDLVSPEFIVLMGNIACQACLGQKGITRLRGQWQKVEDLPAIPMFHPAYLLRNPHAKRETWKDLLDLQARLDA